MKSVKLAKGKEFTFAKATGGGAVSKYPWEEWFNPDPKHFPNGLVYLEQSRGKKNDKGAVTEVTEKLDFEVETTTMPFKIRQAARKYYKNVQISTLDADGNRLVDSLIIKSSDMSADERQAEDMLRAEEADKFKQARAKAKAKKQAQGQGQAA
jgi:hypothetical protein